MDMNKDAKLNYDEFKEGSKQDPTIVQVSRMVVPYQHRILTLLASGALSVRRSCLKARCGIVFLSEGTKKLCSLYFVIVYPLFLR